MNKQSAISSQPSALEEVLKKEWKELTPLERVLITAHELDLHDDERQDVIEPAAAELQRLRAIEAERAEVRRLLKKAKAVFDAAYVGEDLRMAKKYVDSALNEIET